MLREEQGALPHDDYCAACKGHIGEEQEYRWVEGWPGGDKGFWMHARSADCIPGLLAQIKEAKAGRDELIGTLVGAVLACLVCTAVLVVAVTAP